MSKPEPVVRQATRADLTAFSVEDPATFRGFVAEIDGHVIGAAGVFYQNGHPVAFSDITPEMRKYRKTMVRACRMLETFFDQIGGRVYAVANPKEPTAPYLLARLGFVPTGHFSTAGETLVRTSR